MRATDGATRRWSRALWMAACALALLGCEPLTPDATRRATMAVEEAPFVWGVGHGIIPSDNQEFDQFGFSVAASEGVLMLGAPHDDLQTGSAYVFVENGADWQEAQKLIAPDSARDDYFGEAVAMDGSLAIIGAFGDERNRGAAYVYARSGASWAFEQKLEQTEEVQPEYGRTVSVSGQRAAVGGPNQGIAWIYTRSGTTWSEEGKLSKPQVGYFGQAISVSGDRVLVGAPGETAGAGAAYVFVKSGTSWVEEARLVSANRQPADDFGHAVALFGDVALVGAPGEDLNAGAAYVFRRSGTSWSNEGRLAPTTRVSNGFFGTSVSLILDRALVGARSNERGSAFVFERIGSAWEPPVELKPPVGPGQMVGFSVAQTRGFAVAGGYPRGPAFVFRYAAGVGEPCTVPRDCADERCVDGFCCDTPCSGECEGCAGAKTGEPNGTCAVFPAGEDPENECPTDAGFPDSCGADGFCTGAGACRDFAEYGTPCGATTCTGFTLTGFSCDGVGACSDEPRSCFPHRCSGLACDDACADDGDCATGAFCTDGGSCAGKKTQGSPCAEAHECGTGHCVDGFCCSSACDGPCEACSEGEGAASDGTCAFLEAGTSCGQNRFCTGSGAVCGCESDDDCAADRYCHPDGRCLVRKAQGDACDDAAGEDCSEAGCRVCETGHCVDGVCCDRVCTAAEACSAALKVSGDDGACGDAATAADGSPCDDLMTCTSGHCADGVCCNEACDGTCRACSAALKGGGNDGACDLVEAGTNPLDSSGNLETAGEPECAMNPACDTPVVCDASGDCDCDTGNTCAEDGVTLVTGEGNLSCAPFGCFGSDCITVCQGGAECAPGNRCTSDGTCVPIGGSPPPDDGGCGCRTSPASARSPLLLLGAVLVLALRRRRAAR